MMRWCSGCFGSGLFGLLLRVVVVGSDRLRIRCHLGRLLTINRRHSTTTIAKVHLDALLLSHRMCTLPRTSDQHHEHELVMSKALTMPKPP